MKALLTILAAAALSLASAVQARDWQTVAEPSSLQFTASFQGDEFTGSFPDFSADIHYDPEQLDQAHFDVSVSLASVDTQARERDETLTGSDFFDTDKYPKARFVTDSFERQDDGSVLARGTLDLHGIKQPVSLQVEFKPTDEGATLDVKTVLNRFDFGLGASDDWADIGQDVAVRAHLVLR